MNPQIFSIKTKIKSMRSSWIYLGKKFAFHFSIPFGYARRCLCLAKRGKGCCPSEHTNSQRCNAQR